ncbi:MAG: hypothetical protein EPN30_03440 [Actinomycetota bacterium]|nr:MAG: hypothetical protein EPN30_03440 [Actinomycetota bacterium]
MKSSLRSVSNHEDGVVENIFVMATVATSLITIGTLGVFAVQAQRYQNGLDLAVHSAIRDIVADDFTQNPTSLAQSDLTTTFYEMGLDLQKTSVSVASSDGRCGSVQVSDRKTLDFFWTGAISIQLSSVQREPYDPLSSGLGGVATCLGS